MLLGGLSSSLIGPERAEKTHGFGGKKGNKKTPVQRQKCQMSWEVLFNSGSLK